MRLQDVVVEFLCCVGALPCRLLPCERPGAHCSNGQKWSRRTFRVQHQP